MAKTSSSNRKSTIPKDHEQQPADETIAAGEHMDLDEMQDALDVERAAGSPAPTGVRLGESVLNPYVDEERQGMEMTPKHFGPPQYGSPNPATSASRLMTLEDGHPLDGLPVDHPAAISEDYGVTYSGEEIDATDDARDLAEEHGVNLAGVQGTGKDGRITKGDVEKVVSAQADEND